MQTITIYDCTRHRYTLLQAFGNRLLLSEENPFRFVVVENPSVLQTTGAWIWDKATRYENIVDALANMEVSHATN